MLSNTTSTSNTPDLSEKDYIYIIGFLLKVILDDTISIDKNNVSDDLIDLSNKLDENKMFDIDENTWDKLQAQMFLKVDLRLRANEIEKLLNFKQRRELNKEAIHQ